MRKKLYLCLTYYHTLITLIKALENEEKSIIYINNNIEGYAELSKRLKNTGCFESVCVFDGKTIKKLCKSVDKSILKKPFRKRCLKRIIEQHFIKDLRRYEIYLYHDLSAVGKYCVQEKINYHLIEDALDYFKYFDVYYGVKSSSYKKGSFKFWLKDKLGIGYRLWGSSPYCLDIEVNDKNGIKILPDKVFEVPRKDLFDALSSEQKKLVYKTYTAGRTIENLTGKKAILCTQPLFTAGHVRSMNEQMLVFEETIKKLKNDGYAVVIKPHPRDEANYTEIIKKYSCGYIDKNLPSEVLNFDASARYDVAVSITSTAINFLQHTDKKIFMGMEFVKEVTG